MIRVRENGVVVPRHLVGRLRPVRGCLLVRDMRIPELNRISRIAEFLADGVERLRMIDASLVHATEETIVLTGFEQILVDAKLTDFAQTWVLTECEGTMPEGTRGPPFSR